MFGTIAPMNAAGCVFAIVGVKPDWSSPGSTPLRLLPLHGKTLLRQVGVKMRTAFERSKSAGLKAAVWPPMMQGCQTSPQASSSGSELA